MSHKELRATDITAICDSREQKPLTLRIDADEPDTALKTELGTLTTGDYSVKGLEQIITVERKSLDDLLGCIGNERERFEREMQRILAYPARLLVVEATWREIEAGMWRQKVTPAAVQGSLLGWMAAGVPIFFARDHVNAGMYVARFLFIAARRRWREATSLCPALKLA